MSLKRSSSNRFSAMIWPGYVDALAALLLVLIFVLTVTMVVQSVMREVITDREDMIEGQGLTISRQQQQLDQLGQQVSALGDALGAAREREAGLQDNLADQSERARLAEAEARERAARITRLGNQLETSRSQLAEASSRITDFEAEVAALLAARRQDQDQQARLQARLEEHGERASAAELAVAAARSEIDMQAEQARLAAARSQALEALIADLRRDQQQAADSTAELQQALTEAEAARLVDAQAANALRSRLESADAELTAMTLALEESRKRAEDTLTLLAAAEAARDEVALEARSETERQAALLATAREQLAAQEGLTEDSQRRVGLLNEQVASLTARLGSIQALLDAAGDEQQQAELRVADLGQQLNAALLHAAEEREQRLALEAEARQRAEAEARDLARYRSEFFGRLSQILSGREGVQVVGDRFVFQSEVLFAPGAATLSDTGRDQVAGVVRMLAEVSDQIPEEIDWMIRVDGHTDSTPLSGSGRYRDNWELSQARALAVVRFMVGELGYPADRVAATGFADTMPVTSASSPEALAQNRRIELKLTER